MLKEKDVLEYLDATYTFGDYYQFIQLGHPYSYLIDSRLNIFKSDNDRWAIAAERLGYNERGGEIELEIFYLGNCLINLDEYNNQLTNYYSVAKIDRDSFFKTTDGGDLLTDAEYWLVDGTKVHLSLDQEVYKANGIKLKEYSPDQITVEEAARLVIINNQDLFRASDKELYKSIPADLKKILVIDEWLHKDFLEISFPETSDEHLKYVYKFNAELRNGVYDIDFETFEKLFRDQEKRNLRSNKSNRNKKRPASYETWKQISQVIVNGDATLYKPTLKANSHWKNWPESGSL